MPFNCKKLRNLMTAQGLTIYALAQKTGLARVSLAKIAGGLFQPSWRTAEKLALALGCALDDLSCPPDDPDVPEPQPVGRPKRRKETPT